MIKTKTFQCTRTLDSDNTTPAQEGKIRSGRKKVTTPIKALLADERSTKAVLDFLANTKIGAWPEKPRM
jgi:hypothetical protein